MSSEQQLRARRAEKALTFTGWSIHARYRARRLILADPETWAPELDRLPLDDLKDVRSLAILAGDQTLPAHVDQAMQRRRDGHIPVEGRK